MGVYQQLFLDCQDFAYRLPVVVLLSLPGVSRNLLGVCLLDTEKPKLLT